MTVNEVIEELKKLSKIGNEEVVIDDNIAGLRDIHFLSIGRVYENNCVVINTKEYKDE